MAVTITDHRTVWNEADNITGWIGTTNLFTADPDPVEATGCVGGVVSTATVDGYFATTATSLTAKMVYVWVFPRGAMDTLANGGIGIMVSDGTNRMSYHRAGKDYSAFTHLVGPVGWQCLVMDQSSLPTAKTVRAGTEGALNWASISQIGATFKTLAKSVGGVSNCFIDVIRIADLTLNNGCVLTITGGTSGDPGTFQQIATADAATGNLQAYGVFRELGTGLFGCQGPLRFGNATGTSSSWFRDANSSVVFEDRDLATTRYKMYFVDNGVGTTTFILGTKSGTGSSATGSNGCNITIPSTVGGEWDSGTDTDVTDIFLYGSTFTGFTNGFRMRTSQEFISSFLVSSGTFYPGGASVYNSVITASTATIACEVTSVAHMNNIVNTAFNNNNRAIRITTAGEYTFDNLTFSNNTYDIDNASGGAVIINAINGSNVSSFINSAGGTTTIVNAKSFVVNNIIDGSEIRLVQVSGLTELAGVESVGATPSGVSNMSVAADPNNPGRYQATYSYSYTGDVPIYVVVFNEAYEALYLTSGLRANDSTFTVFQIPDRQYDVGSA
jgi:hypothetical protein